MRFLVLLLVVFWLMTLLLRVVARAVRTFLTSAPKTGPAAGSSQDTAIARRLVRDPVCGVHVSEARAIAFRDGTELVHFCSTACRDKYVSGEGKLAANG